MPRPSRQRIAGRVSDLLGMPKDVALDMPCLSMEGNLRLVLENHRGIIEFTPRLIRVQTRAGQVTISGTGLVVRTISEEDIVVEGTFSAVEFAGWEVS